MTRTTSELAPPLQRSTFIFRATPAGGCLATAYDLEWNRPHTRRKFSGIGFRAWNPQAPNPVKSTGRLEKNFLNFIHVKNKFDVTFYNEDFVTRAFRGPTRN
ncbi:hypothetical protein AVEN_174845-1 [Araneus ventricosus]|uniref:Uncharacterized protein n=1 Tax=Araneus ventricosus TaxID=182803 RepID=A0A4Y2KI28_ARAVE|nr:hypothetical protein AVEN_20554-1 [Araneus ventricosus]GBN02131.1 hypothetical protein AVEN_174845-1 [Araneus ventricosus]